MLGHIMVDQGGVHHELETEEEGIEGGHFIR